jgi:hypothetical protein
MRKIFLMPYFGLLPKWIGNYSTPEGYSLFIDADLNGFKKRVKDKLGIDCPIEPGTGKVWDYRPALGLIYDDVIKGYDFWGHTDFDCVYGDVDKWVTDEFLSNLDVHSNHSTYVCGCWTLYRNTPEVNNLFKKHPYWQDFMTDPRPNGWVEADFSRYLESSGLRYKYTFWQGNPWADKVNLKKLDGKLYQDGEEIMMFHFKQTKKWPL